MSGIKSSKPNQPHEIDLATLKDHESFAHKNFKEAVYFRDHYQAILDTQMRMEERARKAYEEEMERTKNTISRFELVEKEIANWKSRLEEVREKIEKRSEIRGAANKMQHLVEKLVALGLSKTDIELMLKVRPAETAYEADDPPAGE